MTAEDLLREAAGRDPGKERQITIRHFIAKWGAKRRGDAIIGRIERDLEKYGLTTQPSFKDGWIDSKIKIVRVENTKTPSKALTDISSPDVSNASDTQQLNITLCFGSLKSANTGVERVVPDDTLEKAQSLMLKFDYSQLAVMSDQRSLRGAVSWESIAQAKIRNPTAVLKDAIVSPDVVRSDDDLLSKIPRIVDSGFVFVQGRDDTICGIVTTADLSEQFASLAAPFFLLAEIERRLRRIIERHFSVPELQEVAEPADRDARIESADELSFGAYGRLLENPERWSRLGWSLDRKVFVKELDGVRKIRNEVMHFSPDPIDEKDVQKLELFLKWIRRLDAD